MKPIGTQAHETGASLLPAFAANKEAGKGESFQAALAHALLGSATPVPVTQPVKSSSGAATDTQVPAEGQALTEGGESAPPTGATLPAGAVTATGATLPMFEARPVPEVRPTSDPHPTPVMQVQVSTSVPLPIEAGAPDQPKKKPRGGFDATESGIEAGTTPATAAPVTVPLVPPTLPLAQVPLNLPAAAEPERLRREQESGSKASLQPKGRPAWVGETGFAGVRPPLLDALLPPEGPMAKQPTPAGEPASEPQAPEQDTPTPAEHRPIAARVTIEELHVESGAPRPSPRERMGEQAETRKGVEDLPIASGKGESMLAPGQRIAHDAPASTVEPPAELRRPDEAPRPAVPTDRVTLHLPDDAGGGRIQIAVRGDVVHARIVSADEAGTREMQTGLDELRSALTRQGFQEAHVRAENGRVAVGGWMSAAAAGESAGAGVGDGRTQSSQTQDRRERQHGAPEDPRSDPRRQHPDGRSQQRARRERER